MRSKQIQNRYLLLLEFVGLFIGIPALIYVFSPLPILPILWGSAIACWFLLIRDLKFDRTNLWRVTALNGAGMSVLVKFLVCVGVLLTLVYWLAPHLLFALIRQRPVLWLFIIFLYPLLSVYPQEVIYRAYFFHRYRALFPNKWVLLALNALSFGYMHIIFQNWVAVALTILGGIIFAVTYHRTRSMLLVSLEHALFGCLIFTIGLGEFFYTGSV